MQYPKHTNAATALVGLAAEGALHAAAAHGNNLEHARKVGGLHAGIVARARGGRGSEPRQECLAQGKGKLDDIRIADDAVGQRVEDACGAAVRPHQVQDAGHTRLTR